VRKLRSPGYAELAMGAIAPGGMVVVNEDVAREVSDEQIQEALASELPELERRDRLFRAHRPPLVVRGRTVLLVDDGLATGATMRVAIRWARAAGAARVVVGVPVGPAHTVASLAREADDVICLATPAHFLAVGEWYADFRPVSEADVVALLDSSRTGETAHA
jgi:predicted phosphoribosyltransferase